MDDTEDEEGLRRSATREEVRRGEEGGGRSVCSIWGWRVEVWGIRFE
jgi:hypothetical protein